MDKVHLANFLSVWLIVGSTIKNSVKLPQVGTFICSKMGILN